MSDLRTHLRQGRFVVTSIAGESVRAFVPEGRRYRTLGTDGFGRSDTRSQLRQFFKVDAASIAATALRRLG